MPKVINQALKSWETTVSGILAFVIVAAQAAQLMLDGNPETTPDWGLLTSEFFIMLALIRARDNNKRSEDVK